MLLLLLAWPALLPAPWGAKPQALRQVSPVMQFARQATQAGNYAPTRSPVGSYPPSRSTPTPTYSGRVVPTRQANQAAPGSLAQDASILVQGGSLRTWSYRSSAVEGVQVQLHTEGRPFDADVELWHGPDDTPCKMRVYVENGQRRPFNAVIATPRGPNTIALRNIGQLEFPFYADVIANQVDQPSEECIQSWKTIQGGALKTYPFELTVESVQVYLRTDGRPLNARIELLQGPNNNKQVIELYTEDGRQRPFFCILQTPGSGNVVRVINTSPVEFPMMSSVVPHMINPDAFEEPEIGGGDLETKDDTFQAREQLDLARELDDTRSQTSRTPVAAAETRSQYETRDTRSQYDTRSSQAPRNVGDTRNQFQTTARSPTAVGDTRSQYDTRSPSRALSDSRNQYDTRSQQMDTRYTTRNQYDAPPQSQQDVRNQPGARNQYNTRSQQMDTGYGARNQYDARGQQVDNRYKTRNQYDTRSQQGPRAVGDTRNQYGQPTQQGAQNQYDTRSQQQFDRKPPLSQLIRESRAQRLSGLS